jgi:hypothetical protein
MQIDALALRLRPRRSIEATDLGVRLCQASAGSVYSVYLPVALPLVILALATFEVAPWLPTLLIWWAKPWLDRTILFVLSRAAFGQTTTLAQVWAAQRDVWWRHLFFTLTVQRLSLWRAFTQPVYQLEGLTPWRARARVRQVRRRHTGVAMMMTSTFATAEAALAISLLSLLYWFAPRGQAPDILDMLVGEATGALPWAWSAIYMISILFIEPFYVAAGFAMYLNRRVELEAWDIEQEFRRAFGAAATAARAAIVALVVTTGAYTVLLAQEPAPSAPAQPSEIEVAAAIARVKADPNLATEQTIKTLRWKNPTTSATKSSDAPSWLLWLGDLFRWIERSARVLMWCVIALLVGFLAFFVVRLTRGVSPHDGDDAFVAPTHVRDLDIRPEALPPEIGSAARALWDRGEHRGALALLYRGLLSRLAHVHKVPIRDASTEGDCLTLAAAHLTQPRSEYAGRLVHAWQRFVYGRLDVQTTLVYYLCDEFGPTLDQSHGMKSPVQVEVS